MKLEEHQDIKQTMSDMFFATNSVQDQGLSQMLNEFWSFLGQLITQRLSETDPSIEMKDLSQFMRATKPEVNQLVYSVLHPQELHSMKNSEIVIEELLNDLRGLE